MSPWTLSEVPYLVLKKSVGTEPGNLTHWEASASSLNCNELAQHHRARSKHIALAQGHRASSMASIELAHFFQQ